MTRTVLIRWLTAATVLMLGVLAFAIFARIQGGVDLPEAQRPASSRAWAGAYGMLVSFSSIIIAVPGAWLAFCFNRRNAFLNVLSDVWKEMVEAKNQCVRYALEPSEIRYIEAWLALSSAIDGMRSVYRNVGESHTAIGAFPFEPLKDMMVTLEAAPARLAAATGDTRALRDVIREEMTDSWQALRAEFLRELGAPFPTHPITERGYRDPRRKH
jgi:hypothetical protein